MPRKLRTAKRRQDVRFTPELEIFLETGDMEPARRLNLFLAYVLTDPRAREARDRYLAGDVDGAVTLLAELPGEQHFLFR